MTLSRSTPSAEDVAAGGIRSFIDVLENSPGIEPHSVMLLRNGRVIAESWWAPYAPDRVHLLYSLSKSFTAAALGFAIAENLVSLDDTVLSHFPHLDAEVTDPLSRGMRVRDVAAMASGHRHDLVERALELDPSDPVRGLLTIEPDEPPGTLFAYNQPCTYALAAIVQARTGQLLSEYLRSRLFEPLGIDHGGWIGDRSGREIGYSGLHATTEAIAKLGQLHLDEGVWGGRRILPAAWIREATRTQVANPDEANVDWRQGYGFQFWMAQHGYRGDGAYGQFCVVLPEQNAVLAITSQTEDMQPVLDAVWEHLLPAFDGARDEEADAALARVLATRALPPAPGSAASERGGPQRFTAAAGNDQPTLTEVEITPVDRGNGDDGWTVALIDGEPLSGRLHPGRWTVSDAIALSGGRDATGELRIDVAFIETPHRLRLLCDPTSATFDARWVTTPLHGGPLHRLRAPGTG